MSNKSIYMYTAAPLFEESGGGGQRPKRSAKISLLEDDDGDLFVPSGARGGEEEEERFEAEDNSELLKYVFCAVFSFKCSYTVCLCVLASFPGPTRFQELGNKAMCVCQHSDFVYRHHDPHKS